MILIGWSKIRPCREMTVMMHCLTHISGTFIRIPAESQRQEKKVMVPGNPIFRCNLLFKEGITNTLAGRRFESPPGLFHDQE